jgi:hypothetical protein
MHFHNRGVVIYCAPSPRYRICASFGHLWAVRFVGRESVSAQCLWVCEIREIGGVLRAPGCRLCLLVSFGGWGATSAGGSGSARLPNPLGPSAAVLHLFFAIPRSCSSYGGVRLRYRAAVVCRKIAERWGKCRGIWQKHGRNLFYNTRAAFHRTPLPSRRIEAGYGLMGV